MINNVFLTEDLDIYRKKIDFKDNKEKLIFSSLEDSNVITKVDDSFFPLVKYSKYNLKTKLSLNNDLILNKVSEIYLLKYNDDNNLILKSNQVLNKVNYNFDIFNIDYNKIKHTIIYSNKTLKYYYDIKIKLDNCDLYIAMANFISLDSYRWYKRINLYSITDSFVIEFSLNNQNDLMKVLNEYSKNSEEVKQFCNYINFYNYNLSTYNVDNYLEDLKSVIKNNTSLRIGPKKMQRITTGILRYFIPINSNENINIYVSGNQISGLLRIEYLKENLTENEKRECDILIRKSKAIIKQTNDCSKIDIYTGEIMDNDLKEVYIDSYGMIIEKNSAFRYYFTKLDDIWVESSHDETIEITDRYYLMKKLTM